jgi:hypothetical protein
VVAAKLGIDEAKEMATYLKEIGDPAGCCWCVGVWDEEEAYTKESSTNS